MSDERARLFVALELPDDVREELIGWRSGVLPERPRLRLIAHEHLHVTLCFLGWQEVTEIGRIGDVLSVAAEAGAARLALGDGIWLPSRRPRVLAATLADLDGTLGRVQALLSDALEAGGWYAPEKRPFLPHVTVARVPAGARVLGDPVAAPPGLEFDGRDLTLYRSHLAPGGAQYEPLRTVALDGGRPA